MTNDVLFMSIFVILILPFFIAWLISMKWRKKTIGLIFDRTTYAVLMERRPIMVDD